MGVNANIIVNFIMSKTPTDGSHSLGGLTARIIIF